MKTPKSIKKGVFYFAFKAEQESINSVWNVVSQRECTCIDVSIDGGDAIQESNKYHHQNRDHSKPECFFLETAIYLSSAALIFSAENYC